MVSLQPWQCITMTIRTSIANSTNIDIHIFSAPICSGELHDTKLKKERGGENQDWGEASRIEGISFHNPRECAQKTHNDGIPLGGRVDDPRNWQTDEDIKYVATDGARYGHVAFALSGDDDAR